MSAKDALNSQQHKEYIYTKLPYDYGGGMVSDEYKTLRRTTYDTGEIAHHEVGKLEVTRFPGQQEKIGKSPAEKGTDYNESWYHHPLTSTGIPHPDDEDRYLGHQGKLFEYRAPTAETHQVDYFAGTREHRAINMTLLGLAENSARAKGTTLTSSGDLSEHSSRLVGHLQRTGAVGEDASTTVTNHIQFHNPYPAGRQPFYPEDRLSAGEVEAGRKTVRQVIRGDKPRPMRGQGSLF